MPQVPTTRQRIVDLFEHTPTDSVYTPTDVAQLVDRSLDSVRTEMRGLYNAGVLRRKLLKGNVAVYWVGDDPLQITAPPSRLALPPAIEVRSTIVAA